MKMAARRWTGSHGGGLFSEQFILGWKNELL
jgi:hypothetical protein